MNAVQRKVRKAYLSTAVAKVEVLLEHERIWKRKATIARNKLIKVRRQINDCALELARQTLGNDGVLP